jgi:cytoskeleton protein RodZ
VTESVTESVSEPTSELRGEAPDAAPQEAAGVMQLGVLLRKAREARGLTVADVVAAVKYSPRQIEALEADQMTLLPGNVFVRGIVRSYARFLKLDPAPLLSLLESEAPLVPLDVRAPEDMGVAMPRTEARQISVLVAVAVLVTIAAAAGAVWHYLAPSPTQVATTAQQAIIELPAPLPPSQSVDLARPALEGATDQRLLPQPERSARPTQPEASTVTPPNLVPVPTTVVSPAGAPAADTVRSTSTAGGRLLAFDFRGGSWVEVKDATQRVIFTGQYAVGSHQVVSGQPPFQIVIGNAPHVDLRYEGRIVDLKPNTRADVARLTLE